MPPRPLALVTGASAGIGREFCAQLAGRGFDLVLVARDAARLGALAGELRARFGVVAEPLAADLAADADVDRVVARIAAAPRLALLVNNAGFGTGGALATADAEGQARMVRVHVLAAMRLAQVAVRGMAAHGGGAIVNVASVAGFLRSVGNVNYCATKAYLIAFSESLAAEVEPAGVRVQALCPGFTHSEFHQRMGADKGEIPAWMWMDAPRVVRESLAAVLDRAGPVVVIPGKRYRVIVGLLRVLPGGLLRRLLRRGYRHLQRR
ncbi:MAG TPA: SDR family NAD(P)-dependent oxidoreductase [Gemmatimonadales bacterium]|nr:SDR family NAD(P)-dependent oxidoreductase [Gemmatimonadales bacterium]